MEYLCKNCDEEYYHPEEIRYCIYCGVEIHSYKNDQGEWVEIPCLFETRGKWKSKFDQSVIYSKT